jgi:signal transduction histidine kinase
VTALDASLELRPDLVAALAGAVGEALTNAAKHSKARRVTVYAEQDAVGLFVSVKDDGVGFDASTTSEGVGLTRSVRARIEDIGGRVEVDANPGHGTEVRVWV